MHEYTIRHFRHKLLCNYLITLIYSISIAHRVNPEGPDLFLRNWIARVLLLLWIIRRTPQVLIAHWYLTLSWYSTLVQSTKLSKFSLYTVSTCSTQWKPIFQRTNTTVGHDYIPRVPCLPVLVGSPVPLFPSSLYGNHLRRCEPDNDWVITLWVADEQNHWTESQPDTQAEWCETLFAGMDWWKLRSSSYLSY